MANNTPSDDKVVEEINAEKRGFWYGLTNKKWLSIKFLYFFKNGAMGAIMPYLIAFYRSRGLTSSQIGIVELFVPFIGSISRPIAGTLADKTGRHRLILFVCFLTFSACFFSLIFIRPPDGLGAAVTNSSNSSDFGSNSTELLLNLTLSEPADSNIVTVFVPILVLRLIGAFPFAPTMSLTDSVTYDALGDERNHKYWGAQRIFGTLSSTIIGLALGFAVQYLGDFDVAFYTFAGYNVVAAAISLFWLPKGNSSKLRKDEDNPLSYCGTLRKLGTNPSFIVACIVGILSGIFAGVLFIVWPQWVLSLQAPKLILGITAFVGRGVEIPGFFFAGTIAEKLGNVPCFLIMFFAYCVRFISLAFLTPSVVWLVVPLEIINIASFALFVTSLTRYGAVISTKKSSATVQAILQTCMFGIGIGIGNLISAEIYQALGGFTTFIIFSVAAGVCGVILLVLHYSWLRNFKEKKKQEGVMAEDRHSSCAVILPNSAVAPPAVNCPLLLDSAEEELSKVGSKEGLNNQS